MHQPMVQTVSPTWGFLNIDAQAIQLPATYNELVHTAYQLGDLIRNRTIRQLMDKAKPIAVPEDLTLSQNRFLWTIYGMLTSGYLFSIHESEQAHTIPSSLAVPLYKLSQLLSMPPILNYDAYVYNNFRKLSNTGTSLSEPESYVPLFTFSSPEDEEHEGEKWFIVVHVATEQCIGPSLARLPEIQYLLEQGGHSDVIISFLADLADSLKLMGSIISRMKERLSPQLYAFTTRKYVVPFRDVIFAGVDVLNGEPQNLRGETGGQSPVPRAIAAFLGLQHKSEDMRELGEHMLPEHRSFISGLAKYRTLKEYLVDYPELVGPHNQVIEALAAFRVAHMNLAATYLTAHSLKSGTGRSTFQSYLRNNLNETKAAVV
jgi:indoleamine 2,3-dioxygenase